MVVTLQILKSLSSQMFNRNEKFNSNVNCFPNTFLIFSKNAFRRATIGTRVSTWTFTSSRFPY